MSEAKTIALPIASVDLSDDQREAIDEAGRWSTNALAELGSAYLEYSDAEVRYLAAKASLTTARAGAFEAEMTRGNVVAAIAHTLLLPPGEWTYDQKQGKLVRKDT